MRLRHSNTLDWLVWQMGRHKHSPTSTIAETTWLNQRVHLTRTFFNPVFERHLLHWLEPTRLADLQTDFNRLSGPAKLLLPELRTFLNPVFKRQLLHWWWNIWGLADKKNQVTKWLFCLTHNLLNPEFLCRRTLNLQINVWSCDLCFISQLMTRQKNEIEI